MGDRERGGLVHGNNNTHCGDRMAKNYMCRMKHTGQKKYACEYTHTVFTSTGKCTQQVISRCRV